MNSLRIKLINWSLINNFDGPYTGSNISSLGVLFPVAIAMSISNYLDLVFWNETDYNCRWLLAIGVFTFFPARDSGQEEKKIVNILI